MNELFSAVVQAVCSVGLIVACWLLFRSVSRG